MTYVNIFRISVCKVDICQELQLTVDDKYLIQDRTNSGSLPPAAFNIVTSGHIAEFIMMDHWTRAPVTFTVSLLLQREIKSNLPFFVSHFCANKIFNYVF